MNSLELSNFLTDLASLAKANKISQSKIVELVNEKLGSEATSPITPPAPVSANIPVENTTTKTKLRDQIKPQHIFYGLGAIVVVIGIVFLVQQIWSDLNPFIKTAITLGPAISAYCIGYYAHKNVSKTLASAFFMISAALFPLGIGMSLNTLGFVDSLSTEGLFLNSVILTVIAVGSYYSLKEDVFLPLSIIAATGAYFTATAIIFRDFAAVDNFGAYMIIALGVSYILIGYYLRSKNILSNLLYTAGAIFILSTMIFLQGFDEFSVQSLIWNLAHTITLVILFYLSIKMQSRLLLFLATLFTIIQLLKFTGEFFAESIGWTISLIIAGLIIIGIGYISFEVNKKFINVSKKPQPLTPTASQ